MVAWEVNLDNVNGFAIVFKNPTSSGSTITTISHKTTPLFYDVQISD